MRELSLVFLQEWSGLDFELLLDSCGFGKLDEKLGVSVIRYLGSALRRALGFLIKSLRRRNVS